MSQGFDITFYFEANVLFLLFFFCLFLFFSSSKQKKKKKKKFGTVAAAKALLAKLNAQKKEIVGSIKNGEFLRTQVSRFFQLKKKKKIVVFRRRSCGSSSCFDYDDGDFFGDGVAAAARVFCE